MKILIVDDSTTVRCQLARILSKLGYDDIIEVDDGGQALLVVGGDDIDLVFLDWEMPNIQGIQVLKAIRKHKKTTNMPVIMCTGQSEKEKIMEAVQAGVNSYMVKPFTEQIIKEKIAQVASDKS